MFVDVFFRHFHGAVLEKGFSLSILSGGFPELVPGQRLAFDIKEVCRNLLFGPEAPDVGIFAGRCFDDIVNEGFVVLVHVRVVPDFVEDVERPASFLVESDSKLGTVTPAEHPWIDRWRAGLLRFCGRNHREDGPGGLGVVSVQSGVEGFIRKIGIETVGIGVELVTQRLLVGPFHVSNFLDSVGLDLDANNPPLPISSFLGIRPTDWRYIQASVSFGRLSSDLPATHHPALGPPRHRSHNRELLVGSAGRLATVEIMRSQYLAVGCDYDPIPVIGYI